MRLVAQRRDPDALRDMTEALDAHERACRMGVDLNYESIEGKKGKDK